MSYSVHYSSNLCNSHTNSIVFREGKEGLQRSFYLSRVLALSDQASSLAPDWILLLRGPRILVSLRDSTTTFQVHPCCCKWHYFILKPFHLSLWGTSFLMKCHWMKQFHGQGKAKGFGNCWHNLSSLILKMLKRRHGKGKSPSKTSCKLATGSALNLRSSNSCSWKTGAI